MDNNIINSKETELILILVNQYKKISIKDYLDELEYYKQKIENSITNNFICKYCNKTFTRNYNYQRHIKKNICGNPEINILNKRNMHIIDALKNKKTNTCKLINAIDKKNTQDDANNNKINYGNNLPNTANFQLKIDEPIYQKIATEIFKDEFRNYIKDRIAKEYDDKSLDEIKKLTPFKKQKISNIFKRQCWNHWVGEHIGKIICPCCKLTEISQLNFSCGHIVSESKGGKLIVENVRPICSNCNSSVYIDNLTDYI